MIAAVTGATGHVGANLVPELLKEGAKVRVLIRPANSRTNIPEVEKIVGDILHPESLNTLLKDVDVVYHLAANISLSMHTWPEVEAVNVTGTRNVVQACLEAGIRRLVHFSSIHAMVQEPLDISVDEMRPLVDSRSYPPYDLSKAAGERQVRWGIEQGLDAVIVSPTAVIGPGDYKPSHIGEALISMAKGTLPALVEGGFDWVDVRDVASGAIFAQKNAPTGAKYLLSGHWVSVKEIASLVAGITGIPAPRLVCPAWLARTGAPLASSFYQLVGKRPLFTSASIRALNTCNRCISHDRASRDLSYRPRPFKETLADTLNWFQNNGMLDNRSSPGKETDH
jgi:dihydroflavonol-4-reductase